MPSREKAEKKKKKLLFFKFLEEFFAKDQGKIPLS